MFDNKIATARNDHNFIHTLQLKLLLMKIRRLQIFLEISLITCLQNNPKFSEDLGVGVGKTVKFLRSSGWHIWANPEWRMIFPKQVENDGNAAPRRNRKQ